MATKNHKVSKSQNDGLRRPLEKIYTTDEVAKLLGKTTATIRRYARSGALVRVKVKGITRGIGFTAASVRRLVEGGV